MGNRLSKREDIAQPTVDEIRYGLNLRGVLIRLQSEALLGNNYIDRFFLLHTENDTGLEEMVSSYEDDLQK